MPGPFKERERKSKWDAEKRGPGGMARVSHQKGKVLGFKKVTREEPAPPQPTSQRQPPAPRAAEVDHDDDGLFDIPPPGVHPTDMQDAARAQGKKPPPTASVKANPFAALRRQEQAKRAAADTGEGTQQAPPKPLPKRANYSPVQPSTPPTDDMPGLGGEIPDDDLIEVPKPTAPKRRQSLPVIRAQSFRSKDALAAGLQEDDVNAFMALTEGACNGCPIQEKCEHFEEDSMCAITDVFASQTTRGGREAVAQILDSIADVHLTRAKRALLFETKLSGGQLVPDVTRQLEVAANATLRADMYKNPPAAPPRSVTTLSISQETTGEAKAPSLLESLIASVVAPPLPEKTIIEAPAIPLNVPEGEGAQGIAKALEEPKEEKHEQPQQPDSP